MSFHLFPRRYRSLRFHYQMVLTAVLRNGNHHPEDYSGGYCRRLYDQDRSVRRSESNLQILDDRKVLLPVRVCYENGNVEHSRSAIQLSGSLRK
jgi:hypothetical protein